MGGGGAPRPLEVRVRTAFIGLGVLVLTIVILAVVVGSSEGSRPETDGPAVPDVGACVLFEDHTLREVSCGSSGARRVNATAASFQPCPTGTTPVEVRGAEGLLCLE